MHDGLTAIGGVGLYGGNTPDLPKIARAQLLHYYELDAHISDLERSVYEPKYHFSLLAAMFLYI